MSILKTVGFPRMMKESGEMRVFLPEFIAFLANLGLEIYVEEGYGSRSGFTFSDYYQANSLVRQCSRHDAFQQDLVIMLRAPKPEEMELIPRGKILFSMLHFPTRPIRVERLKKLGIKAISMDSIANDANIRLVENMHAVAWNGLDASFSVLEKRWPGLIREKPFQVLILGSGMVGKYAVDAATKLGNIERNNQHIEDQGPGAIAFTVGRNISSNVDQMETFFRQCDILVDATQRRNPSRPVVPNEWLAWLPEHAVIADLAVDPYSLDARPPVVRGIEGIPQGNLDQYIFRPDDPEWDRTVPTSVLSQNRRTAVTCYSWPGIHPEACMRHYAQQMEPLMEVLISKGYDALSLKSSYFERALERATLKAWLRSEYYRPQPR
jgi:alanine dehydrogenase